MQRRHALRTITGEGADRWLAHFESAMLEAGVEAATRREVIAFLRPAAYRLTNPGAAFQDVQEAVALASKGALPELKRRIEAQPLLLNQRGKQGVTVLWEACRRGRTETVNWLLECGANVDTPGNHLDELSVLLSPYVIARESGHHGIADLLVSRGAAVDVFAAAHLGDLARLRTQLMSEPAIVHARTPEEDFFPVTPLHYAVSGDRREAAALLMERGAEVPAFSRRLLTLAARLESTPVVSMLLDYGAHANEAEDLGPIERGDIEVARMLVEHGLDLNAPLGNGETFLTRACRGDKGEHPQAVEALLDLGADPNLRNLGGRGPLHVAARAGFAPVAGLLMQRGADPYARDADGATALDLSLKARRHGVITLLKADNARRGASSDS